MKKHKIIALILCIVLCLVFCSSLVFIAFHVDHDCSGIECEICHEIQICRAVISAINMGILFSAVYALLKSHALTTSKFKADIFCGLATPVALKVKLSY